jgi:hypothetical protein
MTTFLIVTEQIIGFTAVFKDDDDGLEWAKKTLWARIKALRNEGFASEVETLSINRISEGEDCWDASETIMTATQLIEEESD